MNYIVPNPNATCPACGTNLGNLVLLCAKCWEAIPNKEKQSLRLMVFQRRDTKSKMAKCVRIAREKRGLHVAKLPEHQVQASAADIAQQLFAKGQL